MAAPVSGTDLGTPWPPVTNPTMVGGCSTVGAATTLPAGGLPPTPTTPAPPPPLEVRYRSVAARREAVVVSDVSAPVGLEVDANKVVGATAIAATPIANPPAGNEVDKGSFTDGDRGGVGI